MKTTLTLIAAGALLFAGAVFAAETDAPAASTPPAAEAPAATPAPATPAAAPATPSMTASDVVTTDSGLQYRELAVGNGASAGPGNMVSVHYTGWLQNADGSRGKKFDSSRDRGEPIEFPLGTGKVIKGWDEGVTGMKVGGRRRLIIPSNLAYGSKNVGNGLIPPNSTLIFEVELVKVQ